MTITSTESAATVRAKLNAVMDAMKNRQVHVNATPDSTASTIPLDNTIPQVTEGKEVLTKAITPTSVTNIITARAVLQMSPNGVISVCAAMFINGAANAVRAGLCTISSAGWMAFFVLEYEWVPGVLTPQTVSVRFGPHSAGTCYVNSSSGNTLGSGTIASSLILQEVPV